MGFIVPIENFSFIWTRHQYRWSAAYFDLYSAFMAMEQWGFFSVPHLLWYGASVYNGHLRGPVTLKPVGERLEVESHYLFYDLGLLWLGFENPTFSLRGICERYTLINHNAYQNEIFIFCLFFSFLCHEKWLSGHFYFISFVMYFQGHCSSFTYFSEEFISLRFKETLSQLLIRFKSKWQNILKYCKFYRTFISNDTCDVKYKLYKNWIKLLNQKIFLLITNFENTSCFTAATPGKYVFPSKPT